MRMACVKATSRDSERRIGSIIKLDADTYYFVSPGGRTGD